MVLSKIIFYIVQDGFIIRKCMFAYPEGSSTQYLRTLVPKAIKGMVLEAESLNIRYLDPLG